jgi:hypothetical protein
VTSDSHNLDGLSQLEREVVEDYLRRYIWSRRQAPIDRDESPASDEDLRQDGLRAILPRLALHVEEYRRRHGVQGAENAQSPGRNL